MPYPASFRQCFKKKVFRPERVQPVRFAVSPSDPAFQFECRFFAVGRHEVRTSGDHKYARPQRQQKGKPLNWAFTSTPNHPTSNRRQTASPTAPVTSTIGEKPASRNDVSIRTATLTVRIATFLNICSCKGVPENAIDAMRPMRRSSTAPATNKPLPQKNEE